MATGEERLDNDVLRQSPDAVSNRLGEGGVVVNLRTNRIFELNATGMRAWELIGEGRTRLEIERQLGTEFEAERARVRSDLDALVAALAREGLVDADPHA
jgi:hypothetical protein